MSTYGVHKLLKRLQRDPEFRERVKESPEPALAEFALTDAERTALLSGHVGRLHSMGVHGYLLNTLPRYACFGITPEQYMQRIREP